MAVVARQRPLRPGTTAVRCRDEGARTNGPRAGCDRARPGEGAGLDRVMRRRPGAANDDGAGGIIDPAEMAPAVRTWVTPAGIIDPAEMAPALQVRTTPAGSSTRPRVDGAAVSVRSPTWRRPGGVLGRVVRCRPRDADERCPPTCEQDGDRWLALRSEVGAAGVVERQHLSAALVGDMDFCPHRRTRPADTTDWSDDDWDSEDVIAWIAARTGIDPTIVGRVLDAESDWLRNIGLDGD